MPKKRCGVVRPTHIENISIAGSVTRMAPVGLIKYAQWFLQAAKEISVSSETQFMPARTYLVCHSLELALKAFLSLNGYELIKLSGGAFGHNLENILAEAQKLKIDSAACLTSIHKAEIYKASQYYSEKIFEYPALWEAIQAYPSRPDTSILIEAAEVLVSSIFDRCLHA